MKLSKITIVFLAVIGTVCSTGIVIRTLEGAESSEDTAEAMANILASCYGNEKFAIGLYGHLPETFIETLWSRTLIPIVLINDTECEDQHPKRLHHRRLNVFVIIVTRWRQLLRAFLQINCSQFFNRRASFLIVDWTPTAKYGCDEVKVLLLLAAVQNTYNVNILCVHPFIGRSIFGYNPFMYRAPAPWQFIDNIKRRNNQILSIFTRKYKEAGVCDNLDFDKANDLGGNWIMRTEDRYYSRIRMESSISIYRKSHMFVSEMSNIFSTFVRQLNGTPMDKIVTRIPPDKITDIGSLPVAIEKESVIESVAYPCMQSDLTIMTNFEGHKSQIRKILTVVDSYSRFGTCLVLLVTLIFFKFVVRQALLPATMNIVRIVCNIGFQNVPENSASRIYLASVLFFVVTMQGIFTGKLASLLTRDVSVEHVQTIQDALDRNYTIYVRKAFANLFTDSMYKGHVVILGTRGEHCVEILLRDPSGACVDLDYINSDVAESNNVYVSNNIISTQYWAFNTEWDWPLVEKFNKVLVTMTETKIVDTFEIRLLRNRLSFVKPDDEDPKIMTLNDLGFAFVILGIGLVCATLSFIVEISVKPIRPVVAKVRRKLSYCYRKIKSRKLRVRNLKKNSVQRLAFHD